MGGFQVLVLQRTFAPWRPADLRPDGVMTEIAETTNGRSPSGCLLDRSAALRCRPLMLSIRCPTAVSALKCTGPGGVWISVSLLFDVWLYTKRLNYAGGRCCAADPDPRSNRLARGMPRLAALIPNSERSCPLAGRVFMFSSRNRPRARRLFDDPNCGLQSEFSPRHRVSAEQ